MKIVIVDTGCANLSSLAYAIQRLNYQPVISAEPSVIKKADRLLLPGVGSASAAMKNLQQRDLVTTLLTCTQPLLGICLGMQLLANFSEEGDVPLLGIIDSTVKRMSFPGLTFPHSGWNRVNFLPHHPLFQQLNEGDYFYFVHGYAIPLCAPTIAHSHYGQPFSTAVQKENFFGVQFHPERSGAAGCQLLKNFLESPQL